MFPCGKVPAGKSAVCALLSLVLERHADAVLRERAACSLDRLTASPEAAKVRNCTSTIALATAAESRYSTLGKNRIFNKDHKPTVLHALQLFVRIAMPESKLCLAC